MSQLFQLANARILLWLNHALAQNSELHGFVAFLTGTGAHLLVLATLLVLWLWPESKESTVLSEAKLPPRPRESAAAATDRVASNGTADNDAGNSATAGGIARSALAPGKAVGQKLAGGAGAVREVAGRAVAARTGLGRTQGDAWSVAHRRTVNVTRLESRAQVLVLIGVIATTYIVAHIVAMLLRVPRPFATYLPVRGVGELFGSIGARSPGSLPADSAAMLGVLPVALFFWGRRVRWLAWLWVLLALGLALGRVAVGVHYPADVIAGVVLGAFLSALAMNAFGRDGRVSRASEAVARGFDPANAPYCYFLYLLIAVLAVEFALSFEHVFSTLATAVSDIVYRLRK